MNNKITKSQIKDFIRNKLSKDPEWTKKALLKIYEKQTSEEKECEQTTEDNGVGFTGIDAEILSSFAKQLSLKKFLSPKQMNLLFKKMPKYWNQVYSISNKVQLTALIQSSQI